DLLDRLPDAGEFLARRLDEQQKLAVVADAALPAINRVDVRDEIHARGLAVAHERMRDVEGLVLGAHRRDDDDQVLRAHGGGFHSSGEGKSSAAHVRSTIPAGRRKGPVGKKKENGWKFGRLRPRRAADSGVENLMARDPDARRPSEKAGSSRY